MKRRDTRSKIFCSASLSVFGAVPVGELDQVTVHDAFDRGAGRDSVYDRKAGQVVADPVAGAGVSTGVVLVVEIVGTLEVAVFLLVAQSDRAPVSGCLRCPRTRVDSDARTPRESWHDYGDTSDRRNGPSAPT